MKVLGIDPSLTSTGVADITCPINGPVRVATDVFKTVGKRNDSIQAIDQRIIRITEFVLDCVTNACLVVIEGPSHGSRGGSVFDRAGLWWRLTHRLLRLEIPVAVCSPTCRAKWATGRGNAPKDQVAVAMARLWPAVAECSNDEWDALALASIGAQHLGWPVPTRAHHADCLTKVAWPDGLNLDTPAVASPATHHRATSGERGRQGKPRGLDVAAVCVSANHERGAL